MKELNTTIKYSENRKDLALSEVECRNVVFSNVSLYKHSTSEGGNKIKIFKDILKQDYGVMVSDGCAENEMNKLLEVYRNIIKNKRNICMRNMKN